ncbi:MAG: hypothetical protein U5L74_05490 [Ideonella sp.]|nr:hypothetical protein [Ideonella sp.]
MARTTVRPNTLEPLPGEAAKPPLRLLERREAALPRGGALAQAPILRTTSWVQVWRRWVTERR